MLFCAQLGWFSCREMPGADRQCRGIRANTEQTTPAQPRSLRLLIEMPANDPEAVPHRGLEALAVQAPVGSSWDAHEGHDPWVHVRHHGEQSLYFIDIGYQFGSCEHVLATSLFGDVAAALREHGSATLDEHCCCFRRPD
jgi:hypothetical protein